MSTEGLAELIDFLFDKSLDLGGRDDVAMDLGDFDQPSALDALVKVATDPEEDVFILDSCGTSIGEILTRKDKLETKYLKTLRPEALREALGVIQYAKPDWYVEHRLKDYLS